MVVSNYLDALKCTEPELRATLAHLRNREQREWYNLVNRLGNPHTTQGMYEAARFALNQATDIYLARFGVRGHDMNMNSNGKKG